MALMILTTVFTFSFMFLASRQLISYYITGKLVGTVNSFQKLFVTSILVQTNTALPISSVCLCSRNNYDKHCTIPNIISFL